VNDMGNLETSADWGGPIYWRDDTEIKSMSEGLRAPTDLHIDGISQGITVKPGETLVLSFRRSLSEYEAHEISSRLRGLIPGVTIVVVDDDVKLTVLSQDKEAMRDLIAEMMIDHFRKAAQQEKRKGQISQFPPQTGTLPC
jgi:hypothetical protein